MLVIDDEPFVARAIAIFISDEHEVTVETCAARALERLRGGEAFDVVICDMMMPEMSGMDFYDALATGCDGHLDRIVFMTGGAYTARARDFLATVPNECVEKPPDPFALRALIRRCVRAETEGEHEAGARRR